MKKNNFIDGAIIATLGIIIVKVIGLLYVIPFNAIIGEQGGALYGYAYTIYQLFLSISSAGFPFAISKLTSEYNALGYKKAIRDTYDISKKIICIISIIIFILLFAFAPQIGKLIIGDANGGSSYEDIGFVIRMVSFAILIVPFLSVTKGFLQGNKYIAPTSISQIIEQIIRVAIILVGSYLCLYVFDLGLKNAVGIAVSGAFVGGLFAYLYLRRKIVKNKLLPSKDEVDSVQITSKEIVKKILVYSVPFIAISLIYNLYNTVDMILLSRTLLDILNIEVNIVESITSIYTTWGIKLNNIILAISTGLITSLIPNIVNSYAKGDNKDVDDKFNKAIQCVLLVIVPITIFLSLLAEPVWTLFYGESYYGPIVYKVYVYGALFGAMYNIMINTLQGLNKYKLVIGTVVMGFIINMILDIPLILLCHRLGLNASYGAVIASIIGFSASILVSMIVLRNKYKFSFKDTVKRIPNYITSYIIFIIVIIIMKLIIPTNLNSRIIQIPILTLFVTVSFCIYIVINYKNNNIQDVFNIDINKIKNKIKNKGKVEN